MAEFDDLVSAYIDGMDPATRPSESARRNALTWYANAGLSTEAVVRPAVRQCVRLAMDFDEVYQQGRKDAIQDTVTSTGSRGVSTTLESTINVLMAQSRQQGCQTWGLSYVTDVQVQRLIESLSARDTLLAHFQDLASLAGTTVSAVAQAWWTDQHLYLSDIEARTIPYSVSMLDGETRVVQCTGFFPVTGDLSVHRVRSLAPAMRQAAGHKPRQRIRAEEDQEQQRVVRLFLDKHKQAWGWRQQSGWPDGKAPKGFWPATARAWEEQYQQQWGKKSVEALRKDDKRLPQLMPGGANA